MVLGLGLDGVGWGWVLVFGLVFGLGFWLVGLGGWFASWLVVRVKVDFLEGCLCFLFQIMEDMRNMEGVAKRKQEVNKIKSKTILCKLMAPDIMMKQDHHRSTVRAVIIVQVKTTLKVSPPAISQILYHFLVLFLFVIYQDPQRNAFWRFFVT